MFTINCKGKLLTITEPVVMGIMNITPDSFYGGSRMQDEDAWIAAANTMLQQGALILDIGGQSTRPGSIALDAAAEKERVIPAIRTLHQHFPEAILSVDTYHSAVAAAAVQAGASIVNDISAGNLDPKMIPLIAEMQVPYIAMHMKGMPATMGKHAVYEHVAMEVLDYFIAKTQELQQAGIKDIIIDPGFGFSKTVEQNFELLRNLHLLKALEKPLLVGLSRKSTIWKTLAITPDEALNGTTVLNTLAMQQGASIIRVHDVKEAVEAVRLYQAFQEA